MELTLLMSFMLASATLAIMPGPDNIYVLTESITKGKRNGVLISVGLCSGVLIHTLAAATGLSLVIQSSDVVFSIIKYLGAAYLLYLAYQAYFDQPIAVDTSDQTPISVLSNFHLIKTGFVMNVLNPKVTLFFVAFLPQFITTDGWSVAIQLILLGVVFMIISLLIFSGVALLAGSLTSYLRSPRFWIYTKWIKIVVLVGLTLMLLFSGR